MDKENKNMETFFQKRLNNFEDNPNGWNEPPEIIWDMASASFPDRKKKNRKPLFFILFSGII